MVPDALDTHPLHESPAGTLDCIPCRNPLGRRPVLGMDTAMMRYLPYLLLWFLAACVVAMFWGLFVHADEPEKFEPLAPVEKYILCLLVMTLLAGILLEVIPQ